MEDLAQKIQDLRKLGRLNRSWWICTLLINSALIIYALTKGVPHGQQVFLIYLLINLFGSIIFALNYTRILPCKGHEDRKYYELMIDRSCWANDLAPIIYFIPMTFGMGGMIFFKAYFAELQLPLWMSALIIFIWIGSLIIFLRGRKFLRAEYKKIHIFGYLSIF